MSARIEDYGFIGNMVTGALVGRDGSIDWLCLPDFDSDACFAALIGNQHNGRWRIAPADTSSASQNHVSRRYVPGTPVLETTFSTAQGTVTVTDFLPLSDDPEIVELVRIVRGLEGRVEMDLDLVMRFDFGKTVPWVRKRDYGIHAVAGPHAIEFVTPVALHGEDHRTVARFTVEQGDSLPFTLAYHPHTRRPHFIGDRAVQLADTIAWWQRWSGVCRLDSIADKRLRDAVTRSVITLKTLTYHPSGAIVAAPTTSLPEEPGADRNWDYRYCWLRDATFALYALANTGYFGEAQAFREWLLRAAAGEPSQTQIMYGLRGEKRLTEQTLDWLEGYAGSRPVRVGNAAFDQRQLDVYGELMDALHMARKSRLGPEHDAWHFQKVLITRLERLWREPDKGIWEIRGPAQNFVYSKAMAWVAFDRAAQAVERWGLDGPADRWRQICDEIREQILTRGFNPARNTFKQSFESDQTDASLLLLAPVGFIAADDPRYRGTVEAVEHDLMRDGLLLRYSSKTTDDGLSDQEGTFLICSFWLVDAYALIGRREDARALLDRLLSLRNDLGLLSEEYDPTRKRLLGNFPQAFSHIGLVNSVFNLLETSGPSAQRSDLDTTPVPGSGGHASERVKHTPTLV